MSSNHKLQTLEIERLLMDAVDMALSEKANLLLALGMRNQPALDMAGVVPGPFTFTGSLGAATHAAGATISNLLAASYSGGCIDQKFQAEFSSAANPDGVLFYDAFRFIISPADAATQAEITNACRSLYLNQYSDNKNFPEMVRYALAYRQEKAGTIATPAASLQNAGNVEDGDWYELPGGFRSVNTRSQQLALKNAVELVIATAIPFEIELRGVWISTPNAVGDWAPIVRSGIDACSQSGGLSNAGLKGRIAAQDIAKQGKRRGKGRSR